MIALSFVALIALAFEMEAAAIDTIAREADTDAEHESLRLLQASAPLTSCSTCVTFSVLTSIDKPACPTSKTCSLLSSNFGITGFACISTESCSAKVCCSLINVSASSAQCSLFYKASTIALSSSSKTHAIYAAIGYGSWNCSLKLSAVGTCNGCQYSSSLPICPHSDSPPPLFDSPPPFLDSPSSPPPTDSPPPTASSPPPPISPSPTNQITQVASWLGKCLPGMGSAPIVQKLYFPPGVHYNPQDPSWLNWKLRAIPTTDSSIVIQIVCKDGSLDPSCPPIAFPYCAHADPNSYVCRTYRPQDMYFAFNRGSNDKPDKNGHYQSALESKDPVYASCGIPQPISFGVEKAYRGLSLVGYHSLAAYKASGTTSQNMGGTSFQATYAAFPYSPMVLKMRNNNHYSVGNVFRITSSPPDGLHSSLFRDCFLTPSGVLTYSFMTPDLPPTVDLALADHAWCPIATSTFPIQ